jgi:hypothetical protein
MKEIISIIRKYILQKQFVFRNDYYDGSETNNEIYETNVIEYEFVNQGNTVCVINNMELQPSISGIPPSDIKLDIRKNEKDVTVYRYRFLDKLNSGCDAMIFYDFIPIIDSCVYTLTIEIDGIPIITPFQFPVNITQAALQALIDANFISPFGGSIIVSLDIFGLFFMLNDFVFPVGQPMVLTSTMILFSGALCIEFYFASIFPFVCEVVGVDNNKLLVKSKMFATVRTSNP